MASDTDLLDRIRNAHVTGQDGLEELGVEPVSIGGTDGQKLTARWRHKGQPTPGQPCLMSMRAPMLKNWEPMSFPNCCTRMPTAALMCRFRRSKTS